VPLLIEFISHSASLISIAHDLAALEFMILKPPHGDRESISTSFYCLDFVKDLFHHANSPWILESIAAVRNMVAFVGQARLSLSDFDECLHAIRSASSPAKFRWVVNSRIVIYFQRQVTVSLHFLASFISSLDLKALPANISTLCSLFGCLFRLLAIVLQWQLKVDSGEVLLACVSFVQFIVHQDASLLHDAALCLQSKSLSKNSLPSEAALFVESIRAVVSCLSLLYTSSTVGAVDVVPSLLKTLSYFESAGAAFITDSALQSIIKVCAQAVGLRAKCFSQHLCERDTLEFSCKTPATAETRLKAQQLVVAVCQGAPLAAARCGSALCLLHYLQPLCPNLSLNDCKVISVVCAHSLQITCSTSHVSCLDISRLFSWTAAAALACLLLESRCSSEQPRSDDFACTAIVEAVPVVVQTVVCLLRHPPDESAAAATATAVTQCCESGIKLLLFAARFFCSRPVAELPDYIRESYRDLLRLACDVDVSSLDPRSQSCAISTSAVRKRWSGIRNVGNTCYAAAILQQLASIEVFVSAILNASSSASASTSPQTLLFAFRAFVIEMISASECQLPLLQPHHLYSRCCIASSSVLHIAETTSHSQDAVEFLISFINQLNMESSSLALSSFSGAPPGQSLDALSSNIAQLFAVGVTETLEWPACGCSRSQCEDSVVLVSEGLLTVDSSCKSFPSIQSALASHFACSKMMRCCTCGSQQASHCFATKRITRLSEVVCIQLRCDAADGTCSKVFNQPSFPLVLDVSEFADMSDVLVYDLQGVVLHHGPSMSSGHYTALVREQTLGDQFWGLHFNDAAAPAPVTHSVIRDISSREGGSIALDSSDLIYSGKPCLLFYVRRQKLLVQPLRCIVSGVFFSYSFVCVAVGK
jgi:ubiquitin C-terminal hydrolase